MTWRRGLLLILAVLAFALIQKRAPDMLSEEQASVSKVSRVEKDVKNTAALMSAASNPELAAPPVSVPYAQALAEDRFCDVVDRDAMDEPYRSDFLRSLSLEEEASVRELASADSPYFADATDKTYSTPAARFIQALQLAHLIEGSMVPKPLPQLERARQILLQLSDEEPGNAAYLLFLLKVEDELEYAPDAIIARIMRADYFDSHSYDLLRAVRERATVNAAKFYASITFLGKLPVPEYDVKLVKDLELAYPGLKEKMGHLMTREGLSARSRSYLAGGFSPIEYALGRSLLTEPLPNHLELDRQRGFLKTDNSVAFDALIDGEGRRRKCDESSKTDFYAAMREII